MTLPSTEELRALLANISPGPWRYVEQSIHGVKYGGGWVERESEPDEETGEMRPPLIQISGSGGSRSYTTRVVDIQCHDDNDANARAIALTPDLIARVISDAAEIARLRERVAQLEAGSPEAELSRDILAELARARTKLPGKNVTFAALVEEVGELATATFEECAERVRKEAVQVAVMAMRMVLDGDHCFDDWRAQKGLDHLDPSARAALTGGGRDG